MMTRMLAFCACAGLLLMVASPAHAGPNEGGTLILHANPSLTFTSDVSNYCGMAGLDSCSHAVTSVSWEPGKKIVFHALAAFPPGSSPRLKGISFGISYDPAKFILAARGSCADFELPDGAWPASGTGTAQTWTTATQTGLLTEVYWFCGYAYAEDEEAPDSTAVELIPHPLHGGRFIDDAFPAVEDTVLAFGGLGLGWPGHLPCGTEAETLGGGTTQGGEEADSSTSSSDVFSVTLRQLTSEIPSTDSVMVVAISPDSSAVTFLTREIDAPAVCHVRVRGLPPTDLSLTPDLIPELLDVSDLEVQWITDDCIWLHASILEDSPAQPSQVYSVSRAKSRLMISLAPDQPVSDAVLYNDEQLSELTTQLALTGEGTRQCCIDAPRRAARPPTLEACQ